MAKIHIQHSDSNGDEKKEAANEDVKSESTQAQEQAEDAAQEEETERSEAAEAQKSTVSLETELAQLKEKAKTLETALKYERADFINYRQRVSKDAEKLTGLVKKKLVSEAADLVETFHNIDKGISESDDIESLKAAYRILRNQLDKLLKQWEVTSIGVPGEAFDMTKHEALTYVEDPNIETPVVREVVKPGFSVSGTVIHMAQVVVANPPREEKLDEKEENETTTDAAGSDRED
jgi:molecular chaperone GrpE